MEINMYEIRDFNILLVMTRVYNKIKNFQTLGTKIYESKMSKQMIILSWKEKNYISKIQAFNKSNQKN